VRGVLHMQQPNQAQGSHEAQDGHLIQLCLRYFVASVGKGAAGGSVG
jgi:hypothetical protein